MRVLGIDPGLERIGWGLVERSGSRVSLIQCGLIETPRIELPQRLGIVRQEMSALLAELKPDAVSSERLLFTVNMTTAMDVAKSLGVILQCIGEQGIPWREFSPPEVKLAVTGHGGAEKKQVGYMVTKLLGLEKPPKPDDVADAVALALCLALRRVG